RGALRDAELLSDLPVGAAAEIGELDRGALLRGQAAHFGAHLFGGDDRHRELADVGDRRRRGGFACGAAAARFFATHEVDRAPVRERPEERAQAAAGGLEYL